MLFLRGRLDRLKGRLERMKKMYANEKCRGELPDKEKDRLNCHMEITLRTYKPTNFRPLPKQWVVERRLLDDDFRRWAKDYEREAIYSKTMVHLAFITLMLKWL